MIFRRQAVEVRKQGGLWDESAGLYSHILGAKPREQMLDWQFPKGARVSFSHLERENDKYSWKGAQIPLLCCEESERIRMADGSVKVIRELRPNDMIQTLQGARKISLVGVRRKEACVQATISDASGNILGRQVHSTAHKLLTPSGWLSYSDLCEAGQRQVALSSSAAETAPHYVCRYSGPSCNKLPFQRLSLDNHTRGPTPASTQLRRSPDQMASMANAACRAQPVRDTDSESFEYARQEAPQLSSVIHSVVLHARHLPSKVRDNEADSPLGESAYARCAYREEDYRPRCSSSHDLCDAPVGRMVSGIQDDVQVRADAEGQTQRDLPLDDLGKAQKCNHHRLRYAHPYTGLERTAVEPVVLGSCELLPCGERWVIDLTVDLENHYITDLGLVNKNCFDELTAFSSSQFFYMLSRNRSTCGVRPYIRATTNPDADSWVAEFISWWIDQDTGYAIPERSGVLRWFIRRGEDLIWGDTKEELLAANPDAIPNEVKSVTFIRSTLEDNKILMEKDPTYLGNLKAQTLVERERLLKGNWKIRPSAGLYFKRSFFEIVDAAPANLRTVRCWDLAATDAEEGATPDWTVGMRMGRDARGFFYLEHVERLQASPEKVERSIINTAGNDGVAVSIRIPQDPGQAGKMQSQYLTRKLAGFNIRTQRVTGDKVTRASPASSQAEAGNIKIVRGPWNEAFFSEVENFPNPKSKDDQVDALSDCIDELMRGDVGDRPLIRKL